MDEQLNDIVLKQFEAAMCTLNQCVQNCPPDQWNQAHGDAPFSQVIFHTLMFADVYLGRSEQGIKEQPYHIENKAMFRDYEELEDRKAVNLYTKAEIESYFAFCLEKGRKGIPRETSESMYGDSGFPDRKLSRLELYIYLIRHLQHHAAQLGLRIQQLTGAELKWVRSGWRDL